MFTILNKNIINYIPIITASLFLLWIYYITLWVDTFDCDFTGKYTTEIVSKPTMIRQGYTANLITYKSTFNYCDQYNITEYHFTPDIITNYEPKEQIKLFVNYFGGVYDFNIKNVKIMALIFPSPILFIFTMAIMEKAIGLTNYLNSKQYNKKKE